MVIQIQIQTKGNPNQFGKVVYDDSAKSVSVIFPNADVKRRVESYLNTEREFWLPESDQIDDFRVEKAKPTDSRSHFELAMNTLLTNTDVWLNWGTEEEVK
ncbi:MAG: hypothetical protein M1398_09205 [Deltaproteobacteria bacterium]|nr:hypothetical protein [Deltaproteobacteria bacterium]